MDEKYLYNDLLAADRQINPVDYRLKYGPSMKNAEGIPLHLEEQAEKRGKILAKSYEALYDRNKLMITNANMAFCQMLRSDTGKVVSVNHAAVSTVPALVNALEQGDNPLWAVVSLHWIRADEDAEWVFFHLCEAVHAYYNVADIRTQLGDAAEEAFDDMRMYLTEALYQFDHRHC